MRSEWHDGQCAQADLTQDRGLAAANQPDDIVEPHDGGVAVESGR
jgi:hypothetical protein